MRLFTCSTTTLVNTVFICRLTRKLSRFPWLVERVDLSSCSWEMNASREWDINSADLSLCRVGMTRQSDSSFVFRWKKPVKFARALHRDSVPLSVSLRPAFYRSFNRELRIFDQPSPVTTPCPLTLRLGFSLVRSISLKSSTPFLKEALISPCLPSSVKFRITSAFDDGGERGKASKSGKKLKDVVDDFLRFATWPSVGVENLFQIKQNGYRLICVRFRPCDFAGRTEHWR